MHDMFYGCSNLEVIDLYGLNLDKIITAHNMFKNNDNMKYIDLLKLENSYLNFTESELNKKDDLTICQRDDIIINTNAKYNCCYFDINTGKCESAQYILAFFDDNTVSYENGFAQNGSDFRNYISFIVPGYNRKRLNIDEKFDIQPNDKIEIHFSSDVNTLENLFYDKYDENVKHIHTIDFSPFNSSSLTNISHLFDGCSNLTSLDISYLDTSLVEDMSYSFSGFKSLISLNLTNFTTSNVKDMTGMFYNSTSLQYLDISNFDLSNCEKYDNILSNLDNIKFINLVNLKNGKDIDKSINKEELFYICQSIDIIINSFAYNCCDYNFELNVCEYIPPTFIDSSTILTPEATTNTLLKSTEYLTNEKTTQEIADSTNIPNTTMPTTIPTTIPIAIPTTIPIAIPTTIPIAIPTTIPKAIPTTIPIAIPTTIPKAIPTTIPIAIPTTIPKSIPTTIPIAIPTTIPIAIPTTIPKAIPTTIPIAIPTTIPKSIPTTIPKAIPTTIPKAIPTTIPKAIPTTIPKAIPTTIPDTIPKSIPPTQLKTTEYIVQTTILDEEKTSFIFLGFSRATIYDFIIRFFAYFSPIKGKRFPWKMTFPVISSNENSRILEQVEANCTLQSSESESKVKYLCEIEKRNANLSGIEIIPDFNFIPQNSIEIAGISPLAGMFMKNLLLYDGKYDAILSDGNIYLMDNSTLKYAKKLFNITGKIDDPQPKVENKSLVLMINTLSEKENMTEADCQLSNKTENNYYNLNCTCRKKKNLKEIYKPRCPLLIIETFY